MSTFLNQVRPLPTFNLSTHQKLLQAALSLLLGALLGFLAKFFDGTPILGLIGTYLGFWILIATLLAAWSRSPRAAALHVFLFFAALLLAYYLYSMVLFGAFPRQLFFAWGAVALFSPIAAFIVWYARGTGWLASFFASLPVSVLLAEGYSFVYTGSPPHGFALLAAADRTFLLGSSGGQRARILGLSLLLFLLLRQFHIVSLILGRVLHLF